MSDPWRDPTATGAVYADPTAPVFIAPIVLPEPDPVYRDDALFASASANWRPAPVPVPPVPVLDESGELILVPAEALIPTPAMLRDQAVAALKAPPAHVQAPASRGGARSTYTAEPPPRPSRRPGPARPPGSVTTSPSTWLPNTAPTPTAAWRQQPAPPTWLPQQAGQRQPSQAQPGSPAAGQTLRERLAQARAPQPVARPGSAGPVTYRATARTPARSGPGGRRRGSSKGWIPGLVILAFVVLANVVPHLNGLFHRGVPSGVDRTVNSYYADVAHHDVTEAAALVCPSGRSTWRAGQAQATSDSRRGIVDHSVTSTSADGSDNYTVRVALKLGASGTGPTNATIKVLKQDSTFYVCGGTTP